MNYLKIQIELFHHVSSNSVIMKKIIGIFVVSLFVIKATAQEKTIKKGTKEYDNYAYFEAKDIYEKVANKGHKSIDLFQKLGDSYYFNGDLKTANKWYNELFAMEGEKDSEYYFRYGQTLKAVGEQKKSDEYFKKFAKLNGNDMRSKQIMSKDDYLEVIKSNSGRHNIENAGINSKYSDYGSSFYLNKLVFASARDTGGVVNRNHSWTNQAFTTLYASELNNDGTLSAPSVFAKEITTKVNESTPVFTADGKTVYFTRNNYIKGKKGTDSKKTTLLKIYRATNVNGKWTNVESLPFNSDEYSVAHPALTPDEKYLYFASNMPGSLGASDLFRAKINSDGTFGTPENLGTNINTEARETFPFISSNYELYFASDGHLGLGGLDVFASKIVSDKEVSEPINIGSPINGPMDDFAYIYDSKSKMGFFTSNRDGGNGYDDIYKFKENIQIEIIQKQELTGVIYDEDTMQILPPGTVVTLFDDKMNPIGSYTIQEQGKYEFKDLKPNTNYVVRAETPEHETIEKNIVTGKAGGKTVQDFVTRKKVKKVTVGDDLAKAFKIEIIYFDLDKSNIRPDAAVDLAKILEVMKQNPTMKVDVRSHTDCRQTEAYNMALSDRRAKSTIAWLVKNGIAADRLTGKGYGESQLTNDCPCEPTNVSTCTEEQHQKNRRSEFIIIAM
jgi:outer membrane protein OmpA-like peptidoglycan-associated protein/tetratricopeptide (TPR) repeat protein